MTKLTLLFILCLQTAYAKVDMRPLVNKEKVTVTKETNDYVEFNYHNEYRFQDLTFRRFKSYRAINFAKGTTEIEVRSEITKICEDEHMKVTKIAIINTYKDFDGDQKKGLLDVTIVSDSKVRCE